MPANTDEENDDDSQHSYMSKHTTAYLLSASDKPASSDFDSSDEEPLSKYVKTSPRRVSSGDSVENDNVPKKRGRGRPKGKATIKRRDFSKPTSINPRHVRRDRVDEECARLGIVYKQWTPLNPEQMEHASIFPVNAQNYVPEQQDIPNWCMLCPRTRVLRDKAFAELHYKRVHHKRLIVIRDEKVLACKCSEIRSHGSDNSSRNQHYHCTICFHAIKSADFLATHMLTQHDEINLPEVRHLMEKENRHRHYSYES